MKKLIVLLVLVAMFVLSGCSTGEVETLEPAEAETRFETGVIEVATLAYNDDLHAISQLSWVENAITRAAAGESSTFVFIEGDDNETFIHNIVVVKINVRGYWSTLALELDPNYGVINVPCNKWTEDMLAKYECTLIPDNLLADYMKMVGENGVFSLGWIELERLEPSENMTSTIKFRAMTYRSKMFIERLR
jgi:hypothetical protein